MARASRKQEIAALKEKSARLSRMLEDFEKQITEINKDTEEIRQLSGTCSEEDEDKVEWAGKTLQDNQLRVVSMQEKMEAYEQDIIGMEKELGKIAKKQKKSRRRAR